MYDNTQSVSGTRNIDAARMTMAELVSLLAFNLDEPVVDGTGLTGVYRFKIELPPDLGMPRLPGSSPRTSGVSTFKAVEGLGLRLERRPTPVEFIVVDSINRTPTEN
jgi:uncharacterized protein (TIGR03435 family)